MPGESGLLGAPGKEKWRFQALNEGTTTTSLEYSQSWKKSTIGNWELDLQVTVVGEEKTGLDQKGSELVKKVFEDLANENFKSLENRFSTNFQGLTPSGMKSRDEGIEMLKKINLKDYTLEDLKVTKQNDVLVITYSAKLKGKIEGNKLHEKKRYFLTTFIKTDSLWKLISGAYY